MLPDADIVTSISAHFSNAYEPGKVTALYTRLCGIQVFLSERIASIFSITQDGEQITLPALQSELHIAANTTTGSWDVFLLADDDTRDFCITSRLPRELGAIILGCKPSAVDPRAVSVLASIVHAKRRSVGRVLESNGIEELADLPANDEGDYSRESDIPSLTTTRLASRMQEQFLGNDFWEPVAREGDESPDTIVAEAPRQNEQYILLLNQVVQEARGLLDFPAQGESLVAGKQSVYRFAGGEQQVWRRMCGCAGELFVSFLFRRLFLGTGYLQRLTVLLCLHRSLSCC